MKRALFLLAFLAASVPLLTYAQGTTISTLVSGSVEACMSGCIEPLINGLFTAALSVGAMLAVLRIGYAGWLYMGSADMWSNKSTAIGVFQDAIIGLLLLLGVWLILYQINPCILNLDFTRNIGGTGTSDCTK